MSEPELTDFEVDPSRVWYGVRRFWWIIILGAVAGLVAGLMTSSSQTVFDVELQESASRARLGGRLNHEIPLLKFSAVTTVMNSTEQHDNVNAAVGSSVAYTASVTPSGLVAIRVVAPTEDSARQMSNGVVDVMNAWLANEQQEVVGQRLAELTQSTQALGDRINEIDFATGDDVAVLLEHSALIEVLVQDQHSLAELTATLDQPVPGTSEVRTATSSSSSRSQSLLGIVAGALAGLAFAAALGLARKRVRDVTDVRRIVGTLPVFTTAPAASPSASAALVSGVMSESGWKLRSPTRLSATGSSTDGIHATMLETSSQFGLGLEAVNQADGNYDQALALVGTDADWADVLNATEFSNVVLVVVNGDPMEGVAEQLRLVRAARLPLVGCVFVS